MGWGEQEVSSLQLAQFIDLLHCFVTGSTVIVWWVRASSVGGDNVFMFTTSSRPSQSILVIKCKYLQMMRIVIYTNNAGGPFSRGPTPPHHILSWFYFRKCSPPSNWENIWHSSVNIILSVRWVGSKTRENQDVDDNETNDWTDIGFIVYFTV